MRYEVPHVVPVEKLVDEAEGIKSLIFRAKLKANPGQYVMIWIPGVDAKPFGVAYLENEMFGITVSGIGKISKDLCKSKKRKIARNNGTIRKLF